MPAPLQPMFILYLLDRIKSIFHEKTSWAEVVSAMGAYLYTMHLIGGHFAAEKDLELFASLKFILEYLDIEVWIGICIVVSGLKFASVISNRRAMKLGVSVLMFFWLLTIIFMTWQAAPWSPIIAFAEALCAFQPFFIARHIRDWNRPITDKGR